MSVEPGKAPLVAFLGIACVLGGATLAWFSSPATLRLARGDQKLVTATLESRLFGLITNRAERVEGIRSVSLVRIPTSSRSRTPARIVFETTGGGVDLGRNQQLFAMDHADVAAFFEDEAPLSLSLSSIARGSELIRFLVAQVIALVLTLGGLGLEWMVLRSMMR